MSENYDYTFKVILLGSENVGKTSIIRKYVKGAYDENSQHSPHLAEASLIISIKNHKILLRIWDPVGQDKYSALQNNYFRGANAAFIVYDITDMRSFKSVDKYIDQLFENSTAKIFTTLVGNKSDLEINRKVSIKRGQKLAKKNNMYFAEVSCLDDTNVKTMVDLVINHMYRRWRGATVKNQSVSLLSLNESNESDLKQRLSLAKSKCCI